jgi:hypothetical protein
MSLVSTAQVEPRGPRKEQTGTGQREVDLQPPREGWCPCTLVLRGQAAELRRAPWRVDVAEQSRKEAGEEGTCRREGRIKKA